MPYRAGAPSEGFRGVRSNYGSSERMACVRPERQENLSLCERTRSSQIQGWKGRGGRQWNVFPSNEAAPLFIDQRVALHQKRFSALGQIRTH